MRLFCLVLLSLPLPALAQRVTEPARGSAERAAILDALRRAVPSIDYAPIRGAIEFTDVRVRSSGRWAFVNATPRRPGGRPTGHCEAVDEETGYGDAQVTALMYRRGSRWEAVETSTCATDVGYAGWAALYGAPPALDSQFIAAPPVPRTARVARTSDGFVALRSAPGASGRRLAQMPGGAAVRVVSCQNEPARVGDVGGRWCEVRYGQQTGWAFGPYLD